MPKTKEAKEPETTTAEEDFSAMLNEKSIRNLIDVFCETTDLDPFIVECCDYSGPDLIRMFNRAASYHNEIAKLDEKLQKMHTSHHTSMSDSYYEDTRLVGYTAKAMKITTRITHYENCMNRLVQSVRDRAYLKAKITPS